MSETVWCACRGANVEASRCIADPGGCPGDRDDFDQDDFGDEDDGYEDCGLMPDGQCTKAGSEECDWICGALDRDDNE